MKNLLIFAVIILGIFFLGTCENAISLIDEIETEVKVSNDLFLVIESVSIDADILEPNVVNLNPGGIFKFQFDRGINTSTVNEDNIIIEDATGTLVAWNFNYNEQTKLLSIEPDPYLANETEYIIKLSGIKGLDESELQESFLSGFTTGLFATGAVSIKGNDANSNSGYSISELLDIDVKVNDAFAHMYYRFSFDDGISWEGWIEVSPGSTTTETLDLGNFNSTDYYTGDGLYYLETEFRGNSTGAAPFTVGYKESNSIFVDLTAPAINSVLIDNGATYSTDTLLSVAVGISDNDPTLCSYRYSTTDTSFTSWNNMTSSSFIFSAGVNSADDISKTVDVEVKDAAGNAVATGNDLIQVDDVHPGAPTITTSNETTTSTSLSWAWSTGTGNFIKYQRRLNLGNWIDDSDFIYSLTIKTSSLGALNRLDIQVVDTAGNASSDTHSISYFPSSVSHLIPDDGASGVLTSTDIDWPDFSNAEGYYLYYGAGTAIAPPRTYTEVKLADSLYNPRTSPFKSNTKYYWYYVPYDIGKGFIEVPLGTSPVYTFTTL